MSLPKVLLMLVIWLIYTVVAYKGCIEQCCTTAATEESVITETPVDSADVAPVQRYALDFNWDDPTANVNDGFAPLKGRILAGMTDDNIFEITGFYHEQEAAPEGFDNMGFARAQEIRNLFPDVPDDRIRLKALLVDEKDGVRNNPFEASSFNWIEAEKQDEAPELEEMADRVIIRFPSGSATKNADPAVDEYLEKLADRVKQSGEKISITGHADNVDSEEVNNRLSKQRAEKVRDILRSKGVSDEQMTIDFKGESQPVATNETSAGRQQNRRVEVRLIKQ